MADEKEKGQDASDGGDDSANGQEPKVFNQEYVQKLRQEAAGYRTQRNEARTKLESQDDYGNLKESADKWAKLEEELPASETACRLVGGESAETHELDADSGSRIVEIRKTTS